MASEKLEKVGLDIKFLMHETDYIDDSGVDSVECNEAIDKLNKIKKELTGLGISWIKKMPEIKLLSISSNKPADGAFFKVYKQASDILDRLIEEEKIDPRDLMQISEENHKKQMDSRPLKTKIIDFLKRIKYNLTASRDEKVLRNLIPNFDEIHALAKKGKNNNK